MTLLLQLLLLLHCEFLELLPAGVRAVIVEGPDRARDGRCGAARCRKQPGAGRTIGFSPPISVSTSNAAGPRLFLTAWSALRLVPRATVKYTFLYQSKEYTSTLTLTIMPHAAEDEARHTEHDRRARVQGAGGGTGRSGRTHPPRTSSSA